MHVSTTEGKDEFDGRTVRHVSSADAVDTRAEQVAGTSIASRLSFVDTEDRSDTDVTVNIA